jgi:hypothetical protein
MFDLFGMVMQTQPVRRNLGYIGPDTRYAATFAEGKSSGCFGECS